MINQILLVVIIIAIIYAIVIIAFTYGWRRIKPTLIHSDYKPNTQFSIIIAFYNEEDNIINLLSDLEKIDYPKDKFEILLVNNESIDDTAIIIRDYIFQNDSKMVLYNSAGGKKEAVWKGINEAEHDYVLSLDGDCRIPPLLLKNYDIELQKRDLKFISGPVAFVSKGKFWGRFMEFEFMSLVASGAGAIGVGLPIMANAANMVFETKVALKAEHVYNSDIASGDDVFLLNYVIKNYGRKYVGFLKSEDSIVTTEAPLSLNSWVNQRLRWASKAKGYSINATSITALVILGFNMTTIALLILSFLSIKYLYVLVIILLFKTIIDFQILKMSSIFFSKRPLLKYIFIFETIYPFYIVIISFAALFHKKEWKDEM